MSFRVAELQMLLGFAQKNRSGKKHELQARAISLLQKGNLTLSVQNKIRELHRQRFSCNNSDSQGSDISCYGSSSASKVSSSSINNGLSLSVTPGGPSRGASNAANLLNSSLPGDYYSSMPRSLGAFDFSASSPSNSKPYISSLPLPYPVLADVKFKVLPFFDVLGELLKPATLMPNPNSRYQESTFSFHLTPQQANDVSLSRDVNQDGRPEFGVQIQMRFCLLETSCEQDDNFPPNICVKVNDKICPLPNPLATNKPGVEPKRPSRPVNITQLCRISPTATNQLSLSWASSEYSRGYAVGVFLTRRLIANHLLQRIKSKGVRNCEYTRAMIKEKLAQDPDSEIATMILRGSLLCPLGKMRIQIPCRAMTCTHIQCFDGLLYLQMNEKKPTWVCPVCDKSALFQHLVIDGLFTEIISQAPVDCTEVQFHEDGTWTPLLPKKELKCETLSSVNHVHKRTKEEPMSPQPKKTKSEIEIITLDSDDEDDGDDDDDNDDDNEDDEDTEEDNENSVINNDNENSSRTSKSTHMGQTTPIISSGSSNSSDTTPNISLPSPDSSSGSSVSSNLPHALDASSSSRTMMDTSHNTIPCYAPANNTSRSGINPLAGPLTTNSGPPSMGTRGRISLGGLPYHSRSNIDVPSSYPGMPILNPNAPPFYPSNASKSYSGPYDYVLSNTNSHPMSYSNYDVYHGHNHSMYNGDISRDLTSYRNSSSSGNRQASDSGPELISLD
ncbi:E3 SUMO-protein ligase PIAS2-like isoform X3 [Panonychus citri]|nr:E3 SUMO-protein ligase PIAS2-like isoform X3 [Panonychus citri]